ncbi:MAG: MiaB/RimO family radical SAM methylthiotransferase [Deferribacteraceae bacterium]|jgi:threonylcarbamoyladenosine tRNA methylthiotransferase MtaB|nr:MiaB/RimO family radical SAM methylthiotransferase [Deferribacteraceae bacterium]
MMVFFKNFGCKVNQSEVDSLMRPFCGAISDTPDCADIAVVNTCAVTEGAERECLKYLLKLKRDNPALTVIAAGCLMSLRTEELSGHGIILSPVSQVGKLLKEVSSGFTTDQEIKDKNDFQSGHKKTRAFLKIQDGCNRYCSYCIIPFLRGTPVSRPAAEVVGEAEELINSGYKELVITGINLGLYDNLPNLLKRLSNLDVKEEYRLRLSSLHLDTLPTALDAALASERVAPHFHISLQSGAKRILSLMGRSYTPGDFIKWVELIRKNFPIAGIGADIITAFPSETDKEFQETYALLSDSDIDYLHVFPYSPRLKTKAADMSGRIGEKIKKERVARLRGLGSALRSRGIKRLLGHTVTVLTEGRFQGHSENYYLIRTPAAAPNQFIRLTVQENSIIL